MSTSLLILLVGAAVALVTATASYTRPIGLIDPTKEKVWLVRAVSHSSRLAAFIHRRLDRTRAGGLLLTVGSLTVLLLAAVAGAVFDMVSAGTGIARWDEAVAEYGASHADLWAVDWYAALTHLGGARGVVTVTVLVGGWGWWRYRNPHVALFMVIIAVGQAVLNTGLKSIVGRDRPDLDRLAPWSGSSFPSGHAVSAAAVFAAAALVITLRSSKKTRAIVAAGAAFMVGAVAATRALLGVHWLTDVLAGVAVGLAWFLVVAVAFGARIMQFGEPRDEVADPDVDAGFVASSRPGQGHGSAS